MTDRDAANDQEPTERLDGGEQGQEVGIPEGDYVYSAPDKAPPDWLKEWGPRSWMNVRAAASSQPSHGASEFGLYTDVEVRGEAKSAELTPNMLLNSLAFLSDTEMKIVLRTEDHIGLLDRPIDWSKGDQTTWVGMSANEEYSALLSLAAGRRIRSGGQMRTFETSPEADPRGRPMWVQHRALTVPGPRSGQRPLLPAALEALDLGEVSQLLELYPKLSGKQAVALVRAARQYQLGLWVAEEDPELAWLRFVSAIEVLAETAPKEKIDHVERLRRYGPRLYAAVSPAGKDVLREVADVMAGLLGSTHRFISFIKKRLPPVPEIRPDAAMRIDWSAEGFEASLATIYGHRSNVLHAGHPWPAPLLSPELFDDGPAPAERLHSPTAVGDTNWDMEQLPMTLHLFEYLVRHALQTRWRELAAK